MKKNILYIHHDSGKSGASRSLSFLLDKISPDRFSAKVHCIFGGPVQDLYKSKPVDLLAGRGIYAFHGSTVTGMSLDLFLRNIKRLPQSLFTSYKLIKKIKPDLVHLNSSCLFAVALATKLVDSKIKTVCHVREPLLENSISAAVIRYMNYFFIDHFIAIDSFTGSSMKVRKNISVIYNAVNFEDYHPEVKSSDIRKTLGLNENDVVFLYLARISKSNGALELISAAKKLTESHPNFHFVLAGMKEGSEDKYSRKVASAAASDKNIHLLNFTNNVPELIAGANILVVPFTQPHFARSIVEASAIGKPTIGANVGGVNELIINQETGLLYNNKDELCRCCIALGTNPILQLAMGKAAFEFAKRNFDNNVSSRRVFEIYDVLLENREAGVPA
jgi:glycosyltransferase involved in cell wall biosynthesis